jgi:hypothetical protein
MRIRLFAVTCRVCGVTRLEGAKRAADAATLLQQSGWRASADGEWRCSTCCAKTVVEASSERSAGDGG